MPMPQVIEGKTYMTTNEAARFLAISTKSFRDKYVNRKSPLFITALHRFTNPLDTRETLYLVSDLEYLQQIRPR